MCHLVKTSTFEYVDFWLACRSLVRMVTGRQNKDSEKETERETKEERVRTRETEIEQKK